jgi:hypothetical protein
VSWSEALSLGSGPSRLFASGGPSHRESGKHNCRGYRCGSFRPHRAQPSRGKPRFRDGELAPPAIKANLNIRRGRHGRMAHGSRAVPIKPDFGRDACKSFRVTFWTAHDNTSDMWGVNNAIRSLPEPYSENCPESIPLQQLAYQKCHRVGTLPHLFPEDVENSAHLPVLAGFRRKRAEPALNCNVWPLKFQVCTGKYEVCTRRFTSAPPPLRTRRTRVHPRSESPSGLIAAP